MSKRDLLQIVDAAYAEAPDEEQWLRGVLEAALPALERGLGVCAFICTLAERPRIVRLVHSPGGEVLRICVDAIFERLPPRVLHECFTQDGGATLSERLQGHVASAADVRAQLASHGAADALCVVASDSAGSSLVLCALLPTPSALTASERRTWLQIALHSSAGLRLRGTPRRDADLSLELSRRHDARAPALDKSARAALRQAARALDRRRSEALSDPNVALALHRAVEVGHWSLVDRFDADGRHFLLLCRSAGGTASSAMLSGRECQATALAARGYSNKRIAYALGLSTGSVSTLLYRAARKWGAGSRTLLTQEWRERQAELPVPVADEAAFLDGELDPQVLSDAMTRAIKSEREVAPSFAAARANSTRIVE